MEEMPFKYYQVLLKYSRIPQFNGLLLFMSAPGKPSNYISKHIHRWRESINNKQEHQVIR